ncbi:hypothetical protein GCM10009560_47640 [Nonomuraea longicatena]|uniref:Uncharacterized protein n=1 Tax=Nonomuraea longicatena TaxID=83682 RepID=A0ABN1Q5G8_9ACTN
MSWSRVAWCGRTCNASACCSTRAQIPGTPASRAAVIRCTPFDFLRIGGTGVAHAWLNELPPDYFETFHP